MIELWLGWQLDVRYKATSSRFARRCQCYACIFDLADPEFGSSPQIETLLSVEPA
jgi:hypothetical protein